jgi:hypothetical protein
VQANPVRTGIVEIKQVLFIAGDGHDARRLGGSGEVKENGQ